MKDHSREKKRDKKKHLDQQFKNLTSVTSTLREETYQDLQCTN